jgi:small subunit ribosomal protein S24e
VNHRKRELREQDNVSVGEKQLYAYTEKRQNISTGSAGVAQMYLITTTRLDPMTYMLFGAYDLVVTERGLDCDGWLPIVGNLDALDGIQRLKTLMDSCMLRVFEGITMGRRHRRRTMPLPVLPREEEAESGDDDDERKDYAMSPTEVKELDIFTRDIVRILNRYSDERIAAQSRQNSRPATPMGSPSLSSLRLPGGSGPSWSGHSTPYNVGSTYNSRPGTPSRLSRLF